MDAYVYTSDVITPQHPLQAILQGKKYLNYAQREEAEKELTRLRGRKEASIQAKIPALDALVLLPCEQYPLILAFSKQSLEQYGFVKLVPVRKISTDFYDVEKGSAFLYIENQKIFSVEKPETSHSPKP